MSDTTIIRRSGQAPLRIRGTLLAEAESTANNADPCCYSGSPGRSQEVRVYRTAAGRFVVGIAHYTQWQGEHDSNEAGVYPSLAECIEYLRGRVPRWMVDDLVLSLERRLGEDKVVEGIE